MVNSDLEHFINAIVEKLGSNIISVSLAKFCSEYAEFVKRNRANKTHEGVLLVNSKLLSYFSPQREINAIRLRDAENFIDKQKKTAPRAVYNYHRTLRAMFNKGIEWNYLKENVFTKIKLPRRQLEKPDYLTEEQLQIIISQDIPEIVKDLVTTAFYTGCRLGELVNLTWQNVNLNENFLTIGNKYYQTKTRKQRLVPVHPKIRAILIKRFPKIIKKENHYVFSKNNGCRFTGDYFSRWFKRGCRKAEIDECIHFHSLRHSAATGMIMKGAPLPTVQKILGHSNIQTTMIYTHPDLDSLRDAVGRL
jgi:integrase